MIGVLVVPEWSRNVFCLAHIVWGAGLPRRIIMNEEMKSRAEQIYGIYKMPEGFIAAQPASYVRLSDYVGQLIMQKAWKRAPFNIHLGCEAVCCGGTAG